jgi:hypothetical protein
MAGRGPPPKPSALRQRRNVAPTASRLETDEQPRRRPPPLGRHPDRKAWNGRTKAWWKEVWSSPMADEYLRADTDGLHMLAILVDRFWKHPSSQLAAEIRLQRQCYGLTPIDRRRLQWEIVRAEQARPPAPKAPKAPTEPVADPRSALRALA